MMKRSNFEFLCNAETIPNGIADKYATSKLMLMRINVGLNRCPMISSTGWRFPKENPIFPVRKFPIQSIYWTTHGLSSPSEALVSSICSAVISGEIYISAGSPGVKCTSMNAPIDMRISTGMEMAKRFKIYVPTVHPP